VALIVSAIRDDNVGVELDIRDCDDRIFIQSPTVLRVSQRSLRWHLGRHFTLACFESLVQTCSGSVHRTPEEITWRVRPASAEPVGPGRLDGPSAA
jgi:hypothetical protein